MAVSQDFDNAVVQMRGRLPGKEPEWDATWRELDGHAEKFQWNHTLGNQPYSTLSCSIAAFCAAERPNSAAAPNLRKQLW